MKTKFYFYINDELDDWCFTWANVMLWATEIFETDELQAGDKVTITDIDGDIVWEKVKA